MPNLASFAGEWSLDRHIEDRANAQAGRLAGHASFAHRGDALVYTEEGLLRMDGASPLRAGQCHLWRSEDDVVAVLFRDGRPFHTFDAQAETPEGRHLCGADRYDFRYDFTSWPDWTVTWTVRGPRKDHTICSAYVGR